MYVCVCVRGGGGLFIPRAATCTAQSTCTAAMAHIYPLNIAHGSSPRHACSKDGDVVVLCFADGELGTPIGTEEKNKLWVDTYGAPASHGRAVVAENVTQVRDVVTLHSC
jgi:hypothetical protein